LALSGKASVELTQLFAAQKAASVGEYPDAALRKDRLDRCISAIRDHADRLVAALNADFGARSPDASMLADIAASIAPLRHARAHVEQWMRAAPRAVDPPLLGLFGARAQVRYQPKGVVGIIVPWNFPLQLAFAPLAGVLAAGNRVMIKMSEFAPETGAALAEILHARFDRTELAVVNGGTDVAEAFSALAFDHLVFTGSTNVGRKVMAAAAANLTPVTLELGGKSPVLIGKSANLDIAAARIMNGKLLNAGQICLAPDYILAPRDQLQPVLAAFEAKAAQFFPSLRDNPDYTAIISERHLQRLRDLIEDARQRGAEIRVINPASEDFIQQQHRKLAPTLIIDPPIESRVMQEEIFGPILPVRSYDRIDDAIAFVNAQPRPLALYYFGADRAEEERVLSKTISGGVTINDVIFHVSMEDLPFGGVGPSGMGAYHGRRGFEEFSHARGVYRQISADPAVMQAFRPPYGASLRRYLAGRIK